MSRFIADTLDEALKRREPKPPRPFRLVTVGGEAAARNESLADAEKGLRPADPRGAVCRP